MSANLANNIHESIFIMIRQPIVIDGILKRAGPGGFCGETDGGDRQRIAILAGEVEEGITRDPKKRAAGGEVEL